MSMYGVREVEVGDFEESRTKQAFREQVNINSIVERFGKTGMLQHVNGRTPFYGDVSSFIDYQTSLGIVKQAEDLFMGMSSKVRERFGNDPALMVEFLRDPANLDEAVAMGMAVRRPDPVGDKAKADAEMAAVISKAIHSKASGSRSKGRSHGDEDND